MGTQSGQARRDRKGALAPGLGRGPESLLCGNRSVWGRERVLDTGGGEGQVTTRLDFTPQTWTLNVVKMVTVTLRVFHRNEKKLSRAVPNVNHSVPVVHRRARGQHRGQQAGTRRVLRNVRVCRPAQG